MQRVKTPLKTGRNVHAAPEHTCTAVLTPMNTLYTHAYRTPVHTRTQSGNIIDENGIADRLAWTARASGIDQLTSL